MINKENHKLLRLCNVKMEKVIGCKTIKLIYDNKKDELCVIYYIVTDIIGNDGDKTLKEADRKIIFEGEFADEDIYCFLSGYLTALKVSEDHVALLVAMQNKGKVPIH